MQHKIHTHSNKSPETEHGDNPRNVNYFQKIQPDTSISVLDVGTHLGTFVYQLHSNNFTNTYGVEIKEHTVRQGKEMYPSINEYLQWYDGETIPFEDGSFDAVTMFDVIEHIPDIDTFLNEVRRVLKPNGYFIFGTPNKLTNIPWEIVNQRSLTKWREYHCSLQTLNSLKRLLESNQFRNITIEKIEINTAYNKNKLRKKMGPGSPLLLKGVSHLPLALFPNFYGYCQNTDY